MLLVKNSIVKKYDENSTAQMRLATAKAVGEMASLIRRPQLKSARPRPPPSLMAV